MKTYQLIGWQELTFRKNSAIYICYGAITSPYTCHPVKKEEMSNCNE